MIPRRFKRVFLQELSMLWEMFVALFRGGYR